MRAGAWNAYLPVLWPGRLPQLGRGRAALVTERDHVLSGMAAEAARYAKRFPGPWGSAETVPARYRRGGLAVRIAVIAPADHAGSRVVGVWGSATEYYSARAMSPAIPSVYM